MKLKPWGETHAEHIYRCSFDRNGRWALGNQAERNCFLVYVGNILAWTEIKITLELREMYWLLESLTKSTWDGCEPTTHGPTAGNPIHVRPQVLVLPGLVQVCTPALWADTEIQDLSLTSSTGPQSFSIIFGPCNYLPAHSWVRQRFTPSAVKICCPEEWYRCLNLENIHL